MNLLFPYKGKIGDWLKEPNITQTQILDFGQSDTLE
jgi:hypothetical protein